MDKFAMGAREYMVFDNVEDVLHLKWPPVT